jgi:hypothetical protein
MPDDDAAVLNRGIRALEDRLYKLTDIVVDSLHISEPVYRGRVRPEELQMATSINEALRACRRPPGDRETTADWPREIGHRRAQQGVPLAAMNRAYTIGGQVLFGAFRQWAKDERMSPERSMTLGQDIWNVVYLHRDVATSSFHEIEDEMSVGEGAAAAHPGKLLPTPPPGMVSEVAKQTCKRVLGPILAVDERSRDLLLGTLAAWLESGCSTSGAASRLGCHRNTVLNRIHVVERLTERSLSTAADRAELALALKVFRLLSGE